MTYLPSVEEKKKSLEKPGKRIILVLILEKTVEEISPPGIGGSKLLFSTVSVYVLGAEVPSPGGLIVFGSDSVDPCLPSFCGLHYRFL